MSQLPAIPPGARPPVKREGKGRQQVAILKKSTSLIDRVTHQLLPYDPDNQAAPDQRARPTIMVGMLLMFILFGIIGLWAAIVPMASGAIAPGRVISESASKTVQHLEGGIVKQILVKEGDVVKAGQVLVRLENTNAQSRNQEVRAQYISVKAAEGRLVAERDNKSVITFDPALLAQENTDPKVKDALDTQRRLFSARRAALEGQISVYNQKMAQGNAEIGGLREQIASDDQQIALLNQEIATVDELLKTGNALKSRLLGLQRQQAQLMGQRGETQAMVSRTGQGIQESRIAILNLRNEQLNAVVKELKDVQLQLSTLEEQGRASADVVRRIDLTAPIDGTITGLQIHTIGGVIRPGDTVMTIVPSNDRLIVEVHVAPQDIESVHTGLTAQVRITAFKSRYTRPVEGKVINVSADRFDDQRTGESYYLARIEVPQASLYHLGQVKLTPGMGAEALIVTGSRTMLSYIMQPIRESFGHAFHDQ